jgi:hypothetical protein
MNMHPKRASKFAPPRTPCVARSAHPSGGLHRVCEAKRGLAERLSRMERAGPGGGGGGSSPPRCRPPTLAVARIFTPPPCPCSSTNPSRSCLHYPNLHLVLLPPCCTCTPFQNKDDEFAAGRSSGWTEGSAGGEGRGGGNDTRPMRVPFLCA